MSKSLFKTPGIYVEEVSSFPPSVVEVSSAVPAFIGYTERAPSTNYPAIRRINSLNDYRLHFGGPYPAPFSITEKASEGGISQFAIRFREKSTPIPDFLMYYNLQLYFQNGGGPCYVVSVGPYQKGGNPKSKKSGDFEAGLKALELEDEPTLIVLSDAAVKCESYYSVVQQALAHCAKMQDRFVILDVPLGGQGAREDAKAFRSAIGNMNLSYGAAYYPFIRTTITLAYSEEDTESVKTASGTSLSISQFKEKDNAGYYKILDALDKFKAVLPPGGAIAGVYASTDNSRGVWKAPANVSLNSVAATQVKISHAAQEDLNIDINSGKSINAIRTFPGKGILVWGGRTLLGNDNDWRYISVRRLFIMVEESLRKATQFAVFEPNDAGTWLKVKSMIDSYLYSLWKDGAMAGESQNQAYFINVGLGATMTPDDILEGKMIVEVGLAPVRPAEFILLRFTQMLQKS